MQGGPSWLLDLEMREQSDKVLFIASALVANAATHERIVLEIFDLD
jgi:hypothetical protein